MVVRETRTQKRKTLRFVLFATCFGLATCVSVISAPPALSQEKGASKVEDESSPEALNLYADAANLQNNSAFDVAVEEWKKLIEKFPQDPIISKAKHYLGICYLRMSPPNQEAAIASFEQALTDPKLEVREESLVNLGLSLFQVGRDANAGEKEPKLEKAIQVFQVFLKDFPDGAFADKALFYSAECEYALGRREKAAKHYSTLANSPNYEKSAIRPDAIYAMGVNFEELKQDPQANDAYDDFLKRYPDHKLAPDVRLRKAELALKANNLPLALELFKGLSEGKNESLQDYILYRYGFVLAKLGKFDESSAVYKRLAKEFPDSQYSSASVLAAGQTLMRDRKYAEAAPFFQKLLANKDEAAAEAAHWLCQIATLENKGPSAIPVAREALTWSKGTKWHTALQMDLADALLDQPATKAEARKIFEQVATEHADDALAPRATYNAAFAALQLSDVNEAKRWADQFLSKYPKDALVSDATYVSAEAQLQLGNPAEAAKTFAALVAADKENAMQPVWQLRYATSLFLSKSFEPTIKQLNSVMAMLKQPPQIAEAHFLIGASQLQLNQTKDAIASLNKSLEVAPKWTQADEVELLLSRAYQQDGNVGLAKQWLQKLVTDFPDSRFKQQAQYRIGQIAAGAGDYDEAVANYDAILNATNKSGLVDFAAYAKAWVLMQKKEYDPALKLLEPLVQPTRKDSVATESRLATALCLRATGKVDESLQLLKQVLDSGVQGNFLGNVLYETSVSHNEKKEYDQAVAALSRIVKEVPSYPGMDKVLYELGWAFKEQDKKDDAHRIFQDLIAKYPESSWVPEASFHVGQAAYAEEKFDRAVKAYSVAFSKTKDVQLQEKSLHKLGWAYFKQKEYGKATEQFEKQVSAYPNGELLVDALFMQAQCLFKLEKYPDAFSGYQEARTSLEKLPSREAVSETIQTLIYLQGAQSARELKKWDTAEAWLNVIKERYSSTPYLAETLYELAYCYQNQQKPEEALKVYGQVAEKYRNEVAARSRFMMGELYFSKQDFPKAIAEFQRVMFGYGGKQAPEPIQNWQARSAIEAGRCAEILIQPLKGERRTKAIGIAKDFYKYILENHGKHELAKQATTRFEELDKLK